MRKLTRMICVLLSLMICVTFCTAGASADVRDGIYSTGTVVEQGSRFIIYVDIPAVYSDARTAYISVDFDPEAFEVADWDTPVDVPEEYLISEYDNRRGYLLFSMAGQDVTADLSGGLRFSALMRAKDSAAPGGYTFTLTDHSLTDAYTGEELWEEPISRTAYVEVSKKAVPSRQTVVGGGISLTSYTVQQGGTIGLEVTIPPMNGGAADKLSFTVGFDGNAFSAVQWSPDLNGAAAQSGNGYLSLVTYRGVPESQLTQGLTFTALLQARTGAVPGDYTFTLTQGTLTCSDAETGRTIELWQPTRLSADVTLSGAAAYIPADIYPSVLPTYWQTPTVEDSVQQKPAASPNPLRSEADEPADSIGDETPESVPVSESNRNYYIKDTDIDINIDEEADPDDEDEDEGYEITDIDDSDDDDDPDDEYEDIDEDDGSSIYSITLDCEGLEGLSEGSLRISTKYRYFGGDTTVYMSASDLAETCAKEALKRLDIATNPHYAFDISVFGKDTGKYITSLPAGGSITFEMPLPKALAAYPDSIEVFHIADGRPEPVERTILREGSLVKLRFTASSFSPYMLVDTDHTAAEIRSSASGKAPDAVLIDDGSVPHNGNLNPATGAAAAVLLPGAAVTCIVLAKKSVRRRKRTRTYVGSDEDTEDNGTEDDEI